ncbi:MAG: glycogen debranching protein [Actinobacteria bacterium]|nr:glycogen debranching protein [Actinomycetota bacterium]
MGASGARRPSAALAVAVVMALIGPFMFDAAAVEGPGPERSTGADLADKRYVAAGDRAYVIGAQDGSFPPMGWHIRGEMGGVWAHPIKLLDGYWLMVGGRWTPAKSFTSGAGYVRLEGAGTRDLAVTRTEFSPDGVPVTLVAYDLRNTSARARTFSLRLDMRSEVMASYPWGWTEPDAKEFNGIDSASYDQATGTMTFKEADKPWFAKVRASIPPAGADTGDDIWGPVPGNERADYQEYGNGTGGRFVWAIPLARGETKRMWVAVAGSHTSEAEATAALQQGLSDPGGLLADKVATRQELLGRTAVELPDQTLEDAFDWGKLNMADLTRTVTDAEIRDVDEGRVYPPPAGTMAEMTGIGAGYPDYPWYFGTDGAYTAFPLVASGQWDTAMAHLRTIKDVSRIVNGTTGKVVHEIMTDGSVYWGANDDRGNTNETSQFATAVHLLWRWSGDDEFRDEMYGFIVDGMRYVMGAECDFTCDKDQDDWPEGNGMVERTGMGSEKLDVTAYQWQALRALQDMALAKGDAATAAWTDGEADAMEEKFDPTWWMEAENLYADSLCNADDVGDEGSNVCEVADQQLQQRHWINATPMEVVLAESGLAGETGDLELAPRDHANAALDVLESSPFTGECGLFHTGVGGGPTGAGELKCWTLPSSVMAVAEANHGRLGVQGALHYMASIAEQLDLEMPGALPEIVPSPEYDPFVDFRDRAMFMQAWSPYGVQWPVIHHFLGIRPDVPDGSLRVVPDVPESWPGLSVADLRVGDGTMRASASVSGSTYTTEVTAPAGWDLVIGHALPSGSEVASVKLDGAPATTYDVVETTRGTEVHVQTTTDGSHTLVVTTQ